MIFFGNKEKEKLEDEIRKLKDEVLRKEMYLQEMTKTADLRLAEIQRLKRKIKTLDNKTNTENVTTNVDVKPKRKGRPSKKECK